MELTVKQTKALDYLEDAVTREVLFGGAAGPGKSALGCYWQLKQRMKYPGTRGFIGRAIYKTLKDTTLKTFFEVAAMQGLVRGTHFDLTGSHDKENANCIMFSNESLIYLRDLYLYPMDPDFDELGSLEITDAFIDECGQIVHKAKETLITRIRFKLEENGLIPKILYCTNPVKSWPYTEFYKPYRDQKLTEKRRFVPALVTDNKHISPSYIESLRDMTEGPQKQRLLHGNWEYTDDPSNLIQYEKILECFTNRMVGMDRRYISCDVARFGNDSTVIGVWKDWNVELYEFKNYSITQTAAQIRAFQQQFGVPNHNTIVDEDGVGGGVVDILKCKGFVNNSRPLEAVGKTKPENFSNLKSQCYFHLAERINKGMMSIKTPHEDMKALVIEELEQVKHYQMDKDHKLAVLPKDKVKELIGRSPDYADTIMMRQYFELKPTWGVMVA